MPASTSKSPFSKEADTVIEDEVPYNWKEFAFWKAKFVELSDSIYSLLIDQTNTIPNDDIRKLPDKFQAIFGSLFYVMCIGTFIGLYCYSFISSMKKSYLHPYTPDYVNYQPPHGLCEAVPITTSGTFLASFDGRWQSDKKFNYANATYQLVLSSYSENFESYKQSINNTYWSIYNNIIGLPLKFPANIVAYGTARLSLMYWMMYTVGFCSSGSRTAFKYNNNSNAIIYDCGIADTANTVKLLGAPSVIFSKDFIYGYISSQNGVCNISPTAVYDTNNNVASMTFSSFDEYEATCGNILNVEHLGITQPNGPNVDSSFTLSIDNIALLVAAAVNIGFITSQRLTIITDLANSTTYVSTIDCSLSLNFYIYSAYPGMTPIPCVQGLESKKCSSLFFCLYDFNNFIAAPIFLQKGASPSQPIQCNCDPLDTRSVPDCNYHEFIFGLMIIPSFDITKWTLDTFAIFTNINPPYTYFNASYIGSYWGQVTASPYVQTKEFADSSYEFCNNKSLGLGGNCTMILFSTFSANPTAVGSQLITQFGKSISQFCTNDILPSKEVFDQLYTQPFGAIEQNYSRCTPDQVVTGLSSLTVALGNVISAVPILLAIISYLIYLLMKFQKVPVSYTESEKAKVIDALAVALLLARDRDLKNKRSGDESSASTIESLVNDLAYTAELNPFEFEEEKVNKKLNKKIAVEMVMLSDIKSPLTDGVSDTVCINNYSLTSFSNFNTLDDLQKFTESILKDVLSFMNINSKIRPSLAVNGDSTTSYQAIRGLVVKTANFKSAKFDLFPALLMPDKRNDYLKSNKNIELLKTIAKLMYFHSKLLVNDTVDINQFDKLFASEAMHQTRVSYEIGDSVITMKTLYECITASSEL